MATKTPLPSITADAGRRTPKHFSSRFSAAGRVAFIQDNAFAFGNTLQSQLCYIDTVNTSSLVDKSKRLERSVRSNVDGSRLDPSLTNNTSNGTRLLRAIQATFTNFNARVKEIRTDLPLKLLCFLVGFYCATAFTTIIGQTGDWDILAAALAMVVVEGIGSLMYRVSFLLLNNARGFITMLNFWKAGLSLGLFLDSFKY